MDKVTRYLVVYSSVVTAAFAVTVWAGVRSGLPVLAAQNAAHEGSRDWAHADFDQLTVHRINIVEPDGTPRLILSDKSRFPGEYLKGKETARPDREDSAGALFLNDEGTENGGLIFGGYKGKDGQAHSFGHLSFDEYENDQTLALDANQDGAMRSSNIALSDLPPGKVSAADAAELVRLHALPESADKNKALHDFFAAHPVGLRPRVRILRTHGGEAGVTVSDAAGHDRLVLHVSDSGEPAIQFLDASGKVTKQFP